MTETIVDKMEQSDRYARTPGKEWVWFLAVNISLCKKILRAACITRDYSPVLLMDSFQICPKCYYSKHSAMGWSAVCDCGISRSYFLDFIYGLQRGGGQSCSLIPMETVTSSKTISNDSYLQINKTHNTEIYLLHYIKMIIITVTV